MTDQTQIDRICIATLRSLSIDAVENAHSGRPGMPMGAAATAYRLQYFLLYDPDDPEWANRDRFVLSAGHASALLYSLLHLTSVSATSPRYDESNREAVTLDDLKRFRQAGSRCAGHPEYRFTPGHVVTAAKEQISRHAQG
jgi:transketolase